MLVPVTRYQDSAGGLHESPESAAAAEVAALLGGKGQRAEIVGALAREVIDRRAELRAVLDALDSFNQSPEGTIQEADMAIYKVTEKENGEVSVVPADSAAGALSRVAKGRFDVETVKSPEAVAELLAGGAKYLGVSAPPADPEAEPTPPGKAKDETD